MYRHSVDSKLLNVDQFLQEKKKLSGSATIVFTNGCFDLLHPGHVDYLTRCKDMGDILVVGLNSDISVTRLKGSSRPVNPEKDRAFVLSALECVDYIIPFQEDTPLELIRTLRPDVLVKGDDWPLEEIAGKEEVERCGGKVQRLGLLRGYSTSGLINRINSLHFQERSIEKQD